jgi:hypothetical protein
MVIVSKALAYYKRRGLDTDQALVYMSPHVQVGFPLSDAEQQEIHHKLLSNAPDDMRGIIESGTDYGGIWPEVYLTKMALDEFSKNGFTNNRIEVSPIDTFSSDKVFSEYKGRTDHKADGRFAVVVGVKK